MKENTLKKQIKFEVYLDEKMYPEKITWDADDNNNTAQEVAAIQICMWDINKKELINFDLWQNKMPVIDMIMFHINTLGSLAKNIKKSTGNEYFANETEALAEKLFKYIQDTMDKKQ